MKATRTQEPAGQRPAVRRAPVTRPATAPQSVAPAASRLQRLPGAPAAATSADVIQLQARYGNRATRAVLSRSAAPARGPAEPATDDEALRANPTGLPDHLRAGVERLSGVALDGVRVHYNSDKPARVQALAYTRGTEIQVAPGQEQHLPHEAWHVVQQARGRVAPTLQMKGGVAVNDDAGLEREAEVMGARAAAAGQRAAGPAGAGSARALAAAAPVVQRRRVNPAQPVTLKGTDTQTGQPVEVQSKDVTIADGDADPVLVTAVDLGTQALKTLRVPRAEVEALRQSPAVAETNVSGAGVLRPDQEAQAGALQWTQMTGGPLGPTGQPRPEDVRQGLIGDCFLISSLEAIARSHPDLIKRAISPHGESLVYRVTLLNPQSTERKPPPITIPVTAWLPTTADGAFAFALGKWKAPTAAEPVAWWPGLLEKAYALARGGFEKIAFGDAGQAFGKPTNQQQAFLQAMGLQPEAKSLLSDRDDSGRVQPDTMKKHVLDALAKRTIVLLSGGAHSYAVVSGDDQEVVISDPYTDKRVAGAPAPYTNLPSLTPAGPFKMTWANAVKAFSKVTTGKAPAQ